MAEHRYRGGRRPRTAIYFFPDIYLKTKTKRPGSATKCLHGPPEHGWLPVAFVYVLRRLWSGKPRSAPVHRKLPKHRARPSSLRCVETFGWCSDVIGKNGTSITLWTYKLLTHQSAPAALRRHLHWNICSSLAHCGARRLPNTALKVTVIDEHP